MSVAPFPWPLAEYTLALDHMERGAIAGVLRHMSAIRNRRSNAYGATYVNAWQLDCESCCAEYAVALYLHRPWNPKVGIPGPGDVGKVEVRSSPGVNAHLLLHPTDSDDAPFVLAIGTAPNFVFPGWCYGREGKRKEYWRDLVGGRPAFFVPQHALHSMLDFPPP